MRALILWVLAGLVMLVLLIFTASNAQLVSVGMWPFLGRLQMPLFLILFAGMFVGVFLSAFVTGYDRVARSVKLRRARKRVQQLEAQVHELEDRQAPPVEDRLLAIEQAQRAR